MVIAHRAERARRTEGLSHGRDTPAIPTNLQPAIDRLKAIAAASGDRLLLGDGPPHPDAELLDLCSDIAYERKLADAVMDKLRDAGPWSAAAQMLNAERGELNRKISQKLRATGKIAATTAAGIYAKALAVHSSRSGAALLAQSLAGDLLDNPALRASLWGATPEPSEAPVNVVALTPRRRSSGGARNE